MIAHDGARIMAAGLPAMAALLTDHGLPTRVWSLHAERQAGIVRDLGQDLAGVTLLGISLHWFYQLPAALSLARDARAAGFRGYVVLGGFTASLFARELVRDQPAVDGVIRGDGERPLLALARELGEGSPRLDRVPNLVWRGPRGGLRSQPLRHVGEPSDLDRLDFGRLDTIDHLDRYLSASGWGAITHGSRSLPSAFQRTHYLGAGRGCRADCVTCGGGRSAQRRHSGRRGVLFRSPERLVDDVVAVQALGCGSIHACFDPTPGGDHWHRFMDAIEARDLHTSMLFESFGLPDERFLARFARVFEHGVVVISPETADEAIRRRIRGFPFTNADLERTLERIGELGLRAQLFLGFLTPLEDLDGLHRTRRWARDLERRFGATTDVLHLPYSTDPGSPLVARPDRWGMQVSVAGAAGYVRELATKEPWLDNLLRHRPVGGDDTHWRAATLGVELELATRRREPVLAREIEGELGRRADRFFFHLARTLLGSSAGQRIRKDELDGVVRRAWAARR